MNLLKQGFTLVEIAVVVAIIGVLSTAAIVTFNKTQMTARDDTREASAISIANALEAYYGENGEYPSCTALTAAPATVTKDTLTGVSPDTLVAPRAASTVTNSITCGDGTINSQDIYAYVGDSTANCTSGTACLQFTLKWKRESDGTIRSISGDHKTQVATSGGITVSATSTGFSTGTATWNAIPNATGYTLQHASNATFTSGLVTATNISTTSYNISGLTQDTVYYVRVASLSASSQGDWSNTATFRTNAAPVPTLTATAASSTQVNLTWTATAGATSYTLQSSPNNSTWTTIYTGASTSYNHTGIGQGQRTYYRVNATVAGVTGAYSAVVNAVTPIDTPGPWNLNGALANWQTLRSTVPASVQCPAGTTAGFDWYYTSNQRPGNPASYWAPAQNLRVTDFALNWAESVTIDSYLRCYTSEATTGWVRSGSRPNYYLDPGGIGLEVGGTNSGVPTWRAAHWYMGRCPAGATGWGVWYLIDGNFRVSAGGITSTDAAGYADGWYNNKGTDWGNGAARVDLQCYGPWGTATTSSFGSFGPACVPTPTISKCWGPNW